MTSTDIASHYRTAIQKYLVQILGTRYTKFHDLMQRMTATIVTQKDATDFGQMLVEIYEVAYLKAVEDYRTAVEAAGFKIDIKASKPKP